MKDYEKLHELLKNEVFPYVYTHKFIGIHSANFLAGVVGLEEAFPKAKRVGTRESAGSGEVRYIAITLEFTAASADEIISLLRETSKVPDLKIIL